MADSVAGVVLAAGAGTRLAPLTRLRPKALCPVGDVPLVDHAHRRGCATATGAIAVNVHHGRAQMEQHLVAARRARGAPLDRARPCARHGRRPRPAARVDRRPAGAGRQRATPGARSTSVRFVDGWDGERIRLLVVEDRARPDFGSARVLRRRAAAVGGRRRPRPRPVRPLRGGWRYAFELGRLDLVDHEGPFVDCGTPADYLRANLLASGGASVVGPGAQVEPSRGARAVGGVARRGGRAEASTSSTRSATGELDRARQVSADPAGRSDHRGRPAAGRTPRRCRCRGCGGRSR